MQVHSTFNQKYSKECHYLGYDAMCLFEPTFSGMYLHQGGMNVSLQRNSGYSASSM
jgi:hypothetical protein